MSVTKGTLLELLQEIYADTSKWVYKDNKNLLMTHDIFKKDECRKFIEGYFDCAGKNADENTLLRKLENQNDISDTRCQHIVVTFFYGLLLYNKCTRIRDSIDKFLAQDEYKEALENHMDAPFAYVWFIICLFHDLGYTLEYKRGNDKEYKDYKELSSAKQWDKGPDGVPEFYKDVLLPYFNYRNGGKDAMNDHGICAGHYLYAELCAVQEKKKKSRSEKKWWKDELKDIFNLAAWVVACHNIWTVREDVEEDAEKYRKDHLKALIIGKDKEGKLCYKIHLHEHPFLFLFCLVDSIEPIKVVKDVTLLDKILLEISGEGVKIDVLLTCACHDKLLENIDNLKSWLTNTSVKGDTGRICLH